jgi:hypothetical protein
MTSCPVARRCQTGRRRRPSAPQLHISPMTSAPHALAVRQLPARRLLTPQRPPAASPPPLRKLQRQREAAHCRHAALQRRPPTLWFRRDSNADAVPPRLFVMSFTVAIDTKFRIDAVMHNHPPCLCRLPRPAVRPPPPRQRPLRRRSSTCRPRQMLPSRCTWNVTRHSRCSVVTGHAEVTLSSVAVSDGSQTVVSCHPQHRLQTCLSTVRRRPQR